MNNKPRYAEGTIRYMVVDLLHITAVITPRTYKLFDKPYMANTICKMKKEGVIEKNKNEEVFECFNLLNYDDNVNNHFDLPYIDYEYFQKYGKADLKRAKYAKGNKRGNSTRIIRNAEMIILMYTAKINALPSQIIDKADRQIKATYYTSRDIKRNAGYKDDLYESDENKKILIATRVNGTLITEGVNYNIYHIGKDLQLWNATGEYKIKTQIENMLAKEMKENCKLDDAILYTYNYNVFMQLLKKSSSGIKFDALANTYQHIYVLPYSNAGRDMTYLMTKPDWDVQIKEMAMEEKYEEDKNFEYACDYYKDGTYTFIFCVPDIKRYILFLRKVIYDISRGLKTKNDFMILCFDYQEEFVLKTADKYANVLSCSLNEFMKDFR